jgi:hypothetical protein
MVAALCIPAGLLAQTPLPPHVLPAGTRLDFVADDSINVETVRPGGRFRLHLMHDLVLDGAPLATAGTSARLIVTQTDRGAGGTTALHVAVAEFKLRQGELPVAPLDAVVSAVAAGTVIPSQTLGSVERTPERTVIHVPAPVPLPSDEPHAAFVPVPAKSPAPFLPPPRRGATPTPLPTTFNPPEPSPSPDDSTAPGAAATPDALATME